MRDKDKVMEKKSPCLTIIAILILITVSGTCLTALATENPNAAFVPDAKALKQRDSQSKQSNQARISQDALKLFIKQVEIYGRIAKPQVVLIFPGSDPKVDGLRINRHFFDQIFRNVEKSSLKRVRKRDSSNRDHIQW